MTILTPSNRTNIALEYDIFDLDRLGYYLTTNNQKFLGKLECMLYCASHGVDFNWIFNDAYYDQLDWSIEPELSLPVLYAQRAQEIRDKYDYLILHLSGGNDSGAILETFLLNDIKLEKEFHEHQYFQFYISLGFSRKSKHKKTPPISR